MYRIVKRFLDLLVAILLLPFLLPIMAIIAIVIKIDDGGPVFYHGSRLGKGGKVFRMCKFRSMRVNAPDLRNPDSSTYNAAEDPRQTRIGRLLRKTSLDELPQVFNVIIGQMSFIGPRPDLPDHERFYEGSTRDKLLVPPGITGYNQAYNRNAVTWGERLTHDVYYVRNLSFWLDLRILFRTVLIVLRREGVFADATKSEELHV